MAATKEEKLNVNVVTDKQARKEAAEAKATTRKPRTRKAKATTTPPKATKKKATAKKPEATTTTTKPPAEAAKPTTPPGVTLRAGSTYYAGQIIAEAGLPAGCTPEMVEALAAAQGKEVLTQHGYDLRAAYHAIRGYLDALGQLPKELQPPAAKK